MLVDDHRTLLWGLEQLIGAPDTGMAVIGSATNREDAIALARQFAPDIILLDIDLNGICSINFLPELLVNNSTKILVFSRGRDQALMDRAILAGARGVVRKDASPDMLLRAIEKVYCGELWIDHGTMNRIFTAAATSHKRTDAGQNASKLSALTSKEKTIVAAIAHGVGMTNKELARELILSEHTLRNYLVFIYRKLGVNNRLELYAFARDHYPNAEIPLEVY